MKLSGNTISVLKNFSEINNNILMRKGNRIRTWSSNKSVLGQAEIPDHIPVDVGIYELKKLLSAIGLFAEPEVDFRENYLTISSGPSKVRYVYANPDVLHVAPDNDVQMEVYVTVDIPIDVLMAVDKARRTLSLGHVSIEGSDGRLWIKALNASGATSDEFAIELGVTNLTFKAVFASENLNLIPMAYQVSIDTGGITHWKGENSVDYWITLNKTYSKFE